MVLKSRLDDLVVARGMASNLKEAQSLILSGKIIVGEERVDKVGTTFPDTVFIRKKGECPFVSRGGYKLQKGLEYFNINPTGFVCADIGASSGGFTDCLLQNGAGKVYAVDVAYGQLAWKIRQDEKVVVIERFNARKLTVEQIPEKIDLAVIDASFISVRKLLLPLTSFFKSSAHISIIGLVKPQFELPKDKVGPKGVVTSPEFHNEAISLVNSFCLENNLIMKGPVASPILGPKGNKEFLIHISGQ